MYRRSDPTSIPEYKGDDKLISEIVLSLGTFWLCPRTRFNFLPSMRAALRIGYRVSDIAVSVTASIAGTFIEAAGGLADRFARFNLMYFGVALSAIGFLLIAVSPCDTAIFLVAGRVIQGLSAASIIPARRTKPSSDDQIRASGSSCLRQFNATGRGPRVARLVTALAFHRSPTIETFPFTFDIRAGPRSRKAAAAPTGDAGPVCLASSQALNASLERSAAAPLLT